MRTCVICDKGFAPRTSRVVTCSPVCSRENKLRVERDRKPVGSRAKPRPILSCKQCGSSFEAHRCDAKFCSKTCHYQSNAEVRRERCRSWRSRHPDRQAASTKRWQAENRDRHLAAVRERCARWRENHPGLKALEARLYRTVSDRPKQYQRERTAAYQIVRQIEQHGLAAIDALFTPPPDEQSPSRRKQREASRRWKQRNPNYLPPRNADKRRAAQRKHNARETAALKLIREIETKGLEALL